MSSHIVAAQVPLNADVLDVLLFPSLSPGLAAGAFPILKTQLLPDRRRVAVPISRHKVKHCTSAPLRVPQLVVLSLALTISIGRLMYARKCCHRACQCSHERSHGL